MNLASAAELLLEHWEQALKCGVCLSVMEGPTTRRCGHTFCHPCSVQLSSRDIPCPLCRDRTPRYMVLSVNATLKTMINDLHTLSCLAPSPTLLSPQLGANDEIDPSELTITSLIAHSGVADVFKGEWRGTPVAVKHLVSTSPEAVEHLKREIRLLRGLHHPNVLRFFGTCFGQPKGGPEGLHMVVELIEGGTLKHFIKTGTTEATSAAKGKRKRNTSGLPVDLIVHIASGVASGLHYLHALHVVHSNLRSENVLLEGNSTSPKVKLADFALACVRAHSVSDLVLEKSEEKGVPQCSYWLAPEVLSAKPAAELPPKHASNDSEHLSSTGPDFKNEGASDIYSLGMLLWEMVTGDRPFEKCSVDELYKRVVEKKERPSMDTFLRCLTSRRNKKTSQKERAQETALSGLVSDCWRDNRASRPTALEIINRLKTM